MTSEPFELDLLGGATERKFREARPEILHMPWGTLDTSKYSRPALDAARRAWTGAAYQEFRTAAGCAAALEAMIKARAPIDLIAMVTRFPLDEMVHVELCARMAAECGGAESLVFDPETMLARTHEPGDDALLRATRSVLTTFAIGEAVSIPLLHATAQAATHDLTRAVLQRIVRDEADHGTFGLLYLDWALPSLQPEELNSLSVTAKRAVADLKRNWTTLDLRQSISAKEAHDLGWLTPAEYLPAARRALERRVVAPLRERGIDCDA